VTSTTTAAPYSGAVVGADLGPEKKWRPATSNKKLRNEREKKWREKNLSLAQPWKKTEPGLLQEWLYPEHPENKRKKGRMKKLLKDKVGERELNVRKT